MNELEMFQKLETEASSIEQSETSIIDQRAFEYWATKTMAFLESCFSREKAHCRNFQRNCEQASQNLDIRFLEGCLGVLSAAKEAYEERVNRKEREKAERGQATTSPGFGAKRYRYP